MSCFIVGLVGWFYWLVWWFDLLFPLVGSISYCLVWSVWFSFRGLIGGLDWLIDWQDWLINWSAGMISWFDQFYWLFWLIDWLAGMICWLVGSVCFGNTPCMPNNTALEWQCNEAAILAGRRRWYLTSSTHKTSFFCLFSTYETVKRRCICWHLETVFF